MREIIFENIKFLVGQNSQENWALLDSCSKINIFKNYFSHNLEFIYVFININNYSFIFLIIISLYNNWC